ncbi:MAG: penicillin acylase family protein, partial [Bacteroidota bacterium]
LALVLTGGLTYLLNRPLPVGERSLPALGPLLSPFTGFWQNGAFASDMEDGSLEIPGLLSEVTVAYDDRLVPHIYADNLQDVYFTQGYVEAKHRLWQMDMVARSTGGRLAEVLGPSILERDQLQRRKGLRWAAENMIKEWETHTYEMEMLEAYINGINAYISSLSPSEYPLEYKILGFAPEPWTVLKSALVSKSMALTLCAREDDIQSTNTIDLLGLEQYDYLFPHHNQRQRPIIPQDSPWNTGYADSLVLPADIPASYGLQGSLPFEPLEYPDENIGSNNWAVSGARTASGAPILCNDPHLNLTLPSIWHEAHLHTPDCNVYGVSLLGIPAIIIGFNQDIAWGITNSGHDVSDWYQIEWADAEKTMYKFAGENRPVEYLMDTFYVKGQAPVIQETPLTHLGPVVYQDESEQSGAMVLRWIAHPQPDDFDLKTFIKLNRAKNYDEYRAALSHFNNPAQNFVFASREGDIAISVGGR